MYKMMFYISYRKFGIWELERNQASSFLCLTQAFELYKYNMAWIFSAKPHLSKYEKWKTNPTYNNNNGSTPKEEYNDHYPMWKNKDKKCK